MTAALPESPVTEGIRSLEVRWIFPGPVEAAVTGWFGRFPVGTESREDTYLLNPDLLGLSVKIRAAGALDVKVYHGSPGILDVAGRVRGHLEFWQKWSFPYDPPAQDGGDPPGWRPVHKTRLLSRFTQAGGPGQTPFPVVPGEPGCEVELTEVAVDGYTWWTLGFEATGPADLLRGELEAAAALVFSGPLPAGMELGTGDSLSYAEWLRRSHPWRN